MIVKKYIILIVGLFIYSVENAHSQVGSYVKNETIKVPNITTDAQIYPLSAAQKEEKGIYYDRMGRIIQAVATKASPTQKDIIQPVVYDNLGRQTKTLLPYVGSDGTGIFRPNAIATEQPAFYNNGVGDKIADDSSPFSQQVFESSPLQRVLSEGVTGTGFQPTVAGNHFKTVIYRSNNSTTDGNILVWNVDGTFTSGTYYPDNVLSVTDGKDEANIETLSFSDISGHLILKRQILSGGNLDTYYIYNNAGALAYMIPPKATALLATNSYNLSASPLMNLVFKNVYDAKGRVVEKTTPGNKTVYIVYDPLNRPVLVQDSKLSTSNQWNYIKYDSKDHAVSQGIYFDNTTTPVSHIGRANMQSYVNGLTAYNTSWFESRSTTSATGYYTNNIFPTTNLTPLGYSYYDDYDIDSDGAANYNYSGQSLLNEGSATSDALKGQPTMVQTRTIGSGLTNIWLIKVNFYDRYGRVIQTQSNNHLNYTSGVVTDFNTLSINFNGETTQSKVVKVNGTPAAPKTNSILTTYAYDHMSRVLSLDQNYNGSGTAVRIATYAYNELGQLVDKQLHQVSGTNYLQSVDYRYNIRGQLLSINNSKLSNDSGTTNTNDDTNDLFGMQLLYDNVDANLTNSAYYNGKLSAVKWMSKDASGTQSNERSYIYLYDAVDRYRAANYAERLPAATGAFTTNSNAFNESSVTYDQGGNILTLNRNAYLVASGSIAAVDNLTYNYRTDKPNQLNSVTDATGSNFVNYGFRNLTNTTTGTYAYDANGNMITDPFKGLTIDYNVINRTDKITVTTSTGRYINYTYDSEGNLLKKQVYNNNVLSATTDYIDGLVFIDGIISFFATPEGRMRNIGSGGTVTLKPEYIIADQNGNSRISFEDNGSGVAVVRQENSYYGFGLSLPSSPVATPTNDNKNLFNGGSEWQNDYSNLPDLQQTFFRNYDAALGRWIAPDPIPESSADMSVYQYADNNPIMMNDPLGNTSRTIFDVFAIGGGYSGPHTTILGGLSTGYVKTDGGSGSGQSGYGFGYYAGMGGADNSGLVTIYNATTGEGLSQSNAQSFFQGLQQGMGLGTFSSVSGNLVYNFQTAGAPIPSQAYELPGGGTISSGPGNGVINHSGVLHPNGNDTNPSTVGHNWFWSVYIGPDNPISYDRKRWDYSVAPTGLTDLGAKWHDLDYDKIGTTGIKGVLTDTRAIGADYRLVAFSLFVAGNGNLQTPAADRAKGLAVGLGIGIASLPKTIGYGFQLLYNSISSGLSNLKYQTVQGISTYNSNFSHW